MNLNRIYTTRIKYTKRLSNVICEVFLNYQHRNNTLSLESKLIKFNHSLDLVLR